jgi:hypothetical protein
MHSPDVGSHICSFHNVLRALSRSCTLAAMVTLHQSARASNADIALEMHASLHACVDTEGARHGARCVRRRERDTWNTYRSVRTPGRVRAKGCTVRLQLRLRLRLHLASTTTTTMLCTSCHYTRRSRKGDADGLDMRPCAGDSPIL